MKKIIISATVTMLLTAFGGKTGSTSKNTKAYKDLVIGTWVHKFNFGTTKVEQEYRFNPSTTDTLKMDCNMRTIEPNQTILNKLYDGIYKFNKDFTKLNTDPVEGDKFEYNIISMTALL